MAEILSLFKLKSPPSFKFFRKIDFSAEASPTCKKEAAELNFSVMALKYSRWLKVVSFW